MKTVHEPWMKLKESLGRADYELIGALGGRCVRGGGITLKLELDYKLADALLRTQDTLGGREVNEFLYFDGDELAGYIGICSFGGPGAPPEITGMVHPNYRRQGIFLRLHELVMDECRRRRFADVLLLCDRRSKTGREFLKKIGAEYRYSEFEMYLRRGRPVPGGELLRGVSLRRASNADAPEIARQNALYFEGSPQRTEGEDPEEPAILPEDEEKRGMTIYLAEQDGRTVGKVHLQNAAGVGGIYGLGVLPEYRGQGLGRALLLLAIQKLTEAGLDAIMLQVAAENATALQLYKSCGFQETSTMDYFKLNP